MKRECGLELDQIPYLLTLSLSFLLVFLLLLFRDFFKFYFYLISFAARWMVIQLIFLLVTLYLVSLLRLGHIYYGLYFPFLLISLSAYDQAEMVPFYFSVFLFLNFVLNSRLLMLAAIERQIFLNMSFCPQRL